MTLSPDVVAEILGKGEGAEEMKKEQMVGTRLPGEVVRDLERIERVEQADRSTTVRRLLYKAIGEWKLDHYGKQYGERKMTLARAAKEAGVSVWEMMDYVRQRRITSQYDMEEWQKDLATVYRRTQLARSKVGVQRCSPGSSAASPSR